MNISIRQDNEYDRKAVYELNVLAFDGVDEADLIDRLRESTAYIPELSLVAVHESHIVGHILFSPVRIINSGGQEVISLALAPMAVHPAYQKQGVGSMLIREGLNAAKKAGFHSVIVLGHTEYYPRFGFRPTEHWNIHPPFALPPGVFMALELSPDALKDVNGIVEYPIEFGFGPIIKLRNGA